MKKFIFTHINTETGEEIIYTSNGDYTHPELTERFVRFLQACGFVFPPTDFIGLEFAEEVREND